MNEKQSVICNICQSWMLEIQSLHDFKQYLKCVNCGYTKLVIKTIISIPKEPGKSGNKSKSGK